MGQGNFSNDKDDRASSSVRRPFSVASRHVRRPSSTPHLSSPLPPPATSAARRPPSTPPGAARTGIFCVSTPSRLPGTEARCRCRCRCATDQGVCGACGRAPPFPQLIVSRRKAAKPINFSSPSFPSERGLSELSVGESRFSLLRARVRLHNQAGRFRASSI